MSRRSKWLIAIVSLLVIVGMIFAATTKGFYKGGVLSPLNRLAVKERSVVVEEPMTHSPYYVRVMRIDGMPAKDIDALLNKRLISLGFTRQNAGVDSEFYYMKGSMPFSAGTGSSVTAFPDAVIIDSMDPNKPGAVYVADLHKATTIEVMTARVMTLGKKFGTMQDLGDTPQEFLDGKK